MFVLSDSRQFALYWSLKFLYNEPQNSNISMEQNVFVGPNILLYIFV